MKRFWNRYKLTFYVLRHPFDGFYEMKFNRQGTLWIALINFLLLWISVSFKNQYTSVIVNQSYPLGLNSLRDGGTLLAMLVLWSVANWSVTSLTDGEGKLKEIFMANCYAMTPMILTYIPATLLSNVLAEGESAFFVLIIGVATVWFVLLVFVGMVTVHNYTAGKALVTVFLTLVALLVIVFLVALLSTLWQQLITFVRSIYTEIAFRY